MEFRKISNYVEQVNGKYYVNSFGKIYREVSSFITNNNKATSFKRLYKKTLGQLRADGKIYDKIVVDSIELTILHDGTILREMFPYVSKLSETYSRQDVKLQLVVKGKERSFHLHSLITRVFKGIRPIGAEIHHIDNNPLNNCIDNLIYLPKEYHYEIHNSLTSNSRKEEIINTFIDYNSCIL